MPQAQLPFFPDGTTAINRNLAFARQNDRVTYFHGHLPVFQHAVNDTPTFRLTVSQFYVNGNATQAELCRAFGVTPISLKRAVKRYREKGAAGFYTPPARRRGVNATGTDPGPTAIGCGRRDPRGGRSIGDQSRYLTQSGSHW